MRLRLTIFMCPVYRVNEYVQNYRALCLSGQIDRSMYVDFWSWASEKRSADGDDIKVCAAGGRCKV